MQKGSIPILVISSIIFRTAIPGLGSKIPLNSLSPKTVTKRVRGTLREKFGDSKAKVSCTASIQNGVWTGCCIIGDKRYQYTVQ